MTDLIVRNVSTAKQNQVDIEIIDGVIDRIVPAGQGNADKFEIEDRFNAKGKLVTPPLIEPHTHLDTALSARDIGWNNSGTLEEGWAIWSEAEEGLSPESVKERVETVLKWFIVNGVTRIRTHVDVSFNDFQMVDILLSYKDKYSKYIDIQIVALSLNSMVNDDETVSQFQTALEMGVDVVGGMPHRENTREDGVKHVETVVDLARGYDTPLDLHIDETDDPQTRYTEVLANEVLKYNIGDQTTASHVTALHSYSNSYAQKLIHLISESGIRVVTNPMSNSVLQGRYDSYPKRRGYTRIKELKRSGVPIAIGQDNIGDPFHHYGDGDPIKAMFVLLHFGHMNGHDDLDLLWDMLLTGNNEVYQANDYGIEVGNEGSLVVFDAPTRFEALRTLAPRSAVVINGEVISTSCRTNELNIFDGNIELTIN